MKQHHALGHFLAGITALIFLGVITPAIADITTTGFVEPASVTTGSVIGERVFIGDPDNSGSLTIDDGSNLLVDNVNGSGGIATFYNAGLLTVSSGSVELNARTALLIGGSGSVTIDNGSYVLLNGSDDRDPTIFNRGRAMIVGYSDESGFVTIDGAGTHVEMIRRFNIKSTGGGTGIGLGRVTISNGALVTQDSSDSSLITGFTVGATGRGELILESGGTLLSTVPTMRLANSVDAWSFGLMDLSGGSLVELTTAAYIGSGAGTAILNVGSSTFRVLEDSLAPVPQTGDLYTAIGGSNAIISVINGQFEVTNRMIMATGDPASNADVDFQTGSTAVIGDLLGISHDGSSASGHGNGHTTVCDSTLTVPTILVGETGTLAGGGASGVANIIGDVFVEGGTLEPGCSPGEMTVDGNVAFTDGELRVEIYDVDDYDILTVLGNLGFGDGTVVFEFGNGFGPSAGDQFDFLQAGGLSGTENLDYEFKGLLDGFEFDVGEGGDGLTFTALTDGTPEYVEAHMDIRPGEENIVNPGSNQLFPVAILTTQDAPIFDATEVDPSTLAFGPGGASPVPGKTRLKDVDGDGDSDLRVWFRIVTTGLVCGDSGAELTGMTFEGTEFSSHDTLITTGCD